MGKLAAIAQFLREWRDWAGTGTVAVGLTVLLIVAFLIWGCSAPPDAPKPVQPVKLQPGNMVPPYPPGTPCEIAPPIRSGK